ncbi:MAG: diguanylate cyclase [Proteobacteria bacterium]|nr:diguanylate cyclase [Pseudomonadota bacterium]
MELNLENNIGKKRLKLYILLGAIIWTCIIVVSLMWNIQQSKIQTITKADVMARLSFDKDASFRIWATFHGGVYVPITEETKPNTYLNIPDRDIETKNNKSLTLMNPAYIMRQYYEMFEKKDGVKGHITSLKPLRPENIPDPWEEKSLKTFEQGIKEATTIQTIGNTEYVRLMKPFIVTKGCLKCHSAQGYSEGDIRGGISTSVPMAPLRSLERDRIITFIRIHSFFWLIGISGIAIFGKQIIKKENKRYEAEEKIIYERNRFQTFLERSPFGIMLIGDNNLILYVNPKFTEIFGYMYDDIPDGKTWFKKAFPDDEYRQNVISTWKDDLKAARIGEKRLRTFIATCKDRTEKVIDFITVQLESGEHLMTLEDRTELHRYQENLAYSAIHDALTSLLNRRSLEEILDRSIAKAKRKITSSLLYMDLDNFKDVNDTVGHSAGDDALIILTGILKEALRTEDIVFRVGGDEFAVLLEGIGIEEALPAAERLRASVEMHIFKFDGHVFPLSLSIGLIEIDGALTISELLSRADAAMYRAKKEGKNRIVQA